MRDSPEGFGSEKSEQRPSGEDNGGTACHSWPVGLGELEESGGHDNCRRGCPTASEGKREKGDEGLNSEGGWPKHLFIGTCQNPAAHAGPKTGDVRRHQSPKDSVQMIGRDGVRAERSVE